MTFYAPRNVRGEATQKCLSFALNMLLITFGNMFLWAGKLKKKEGIEENYITINLKLQNLHLFANVKCYFED